MKKKLVIFVLAVCACPGALHAQPDTTFQKKMTDTAGFTLPAFVTHAYEQYRPVITLPAAVSIIGPEDLNSYGNNNLLQAVNTAPGVRMEERSPGSYRFSIRGSALESPFGVRNVKVYYNDIPFTDPSGNTYLNQLGFYNIQSLEVIKGPGSSLYGAGTGGVLLISSMPQLWQQGAALNYTGGSYGMNNVEGEVHIGDSTFRNVVRYQHLQSNGYRQQSAMHNDVVSWDAAMKRNDKSELDAHFFYGDLYYQTPGGLTLQEYNADPAAARPAAGSSPGAVQAQAAIFQKTFLSGFTYKQQFSTVWSNKTTLYGDYSTQANPNIRNYSRTSEPTFGGRTTFDYETSGANTSFQWITGAEAQQENAQNKTYQNANGNPENIQSDQQINNGQLSVFTQAYWQLGQWIVTGGISVNWLKVDYTDLSALAPRQENKQYNNQLAPRLAVMYSITKNISVYTSAEKGFSPPTINELVPTGSPVNLGLNPEYGWDYEAGFRGYIAQRLYADIDFFYFLLQNSIVQRRDSAGGDYYINSGGAVEAGAELYARYDLSHENRLVHSFAWFSCTASSFHYSNFIQLSDNYTGKMLPGTPGSSASVGFELSVPMGIYLNARYYFSGRIPLNDANTAFAAPYHLLGCRLGYRKKIKRCSFDIFAGADNILNQKYSLGNDINAAGGRYYNAATPISYYAGLALGYFK